MEDITENTVIRFRHAIGPEQEYILESTSRRVLLLDYYRDDRLDINRSPMTIRRRKQ